MSDEDDKVHAKLLSLKKRLCEKQKQTRQNQVAEPFTVPRVSENSRESSPPGPSRLRTDNGPSSPVPFVLGNNCGATFINITAQGIVTTGREGLQVSASPAWLRANLGRGQGAPLVGPSSSANSGFLGSKENANRSKQVRVKPTTDEERQQLQATTSVRDKTAPAPEAPRNRVNMRRLSFLAPPEGLLDQLICSFCQNIPAPPPAICRAGHLACRPCIGGKNPDLLRCTFQYGSRICSEPFLDGMSKLYEYIYNNSGFICPYEEIGCTVEPLGYDLERHIKTCSFRPYVPCPFLPCAERKVSAALFVRHMEDHGVGVSEGGSYRLRSDYAKANFDENTMYSNAQLRWVGQILMFKGFYFSLVIETNDKCVVLWCSHMCDPETSTARPFDARISIRAATGTTAVAWEGEVQSRDKPFKEILTDGDCLSITKHALRHKFVYQSFASMYWNTDIRIWERRTNVVDPSVTLSQPFPPRKIHLMPKATPIKALIEANAEPEVPAVEAQEVPPTIEAQPAASTIDVQEDSREEAVEATIIDAKEETETSESEVAVDISIVDVKEETSGSKVAVDSPIADVKEVSSAPEIAPETAVVDVKEGPSEPEVVSETAVVDVEVEPSGPEVVADIPIVDVNEDPSGPDVAPEIAVVDVKEDPPRPDVEADVPIVDVKDEASGPEFAPEIPVVDVKEKSSAPEITLETAVVDVKEEPSGPDVAPEIAVVDLSEEPSRPEAAADVPISDVKVEPSGLEVATDIPIVDVKEEVSGPEVAPEIAVVDVKEEPSRPEVATDIRVDVNGEPAGPEFAPEIAVVDVKEEPSGPEVAPDIPIVDVKEEACGPEIAIVDIKAGPQVATSRKKRQDRKSKKK